jgi:pimeloyl-ACP methyl ester carboxylesterase
MTSAPTIVFLHGMYLNGQSWAPWLERAAARGYPGHAPSWPYHDGDPATLRSNVDPRLGRLTFGAVTRHMKAFIDTLPERPVLIGHSIGGLLVQKLVNDGYARVAVSISSAPALGVLSGDPHFWRANFPHINPFAGNRPVRMTPERFHYTFANTMSRAASDAAFERYVVPESRNVPRSTLTPAARIRFRAPHAPLLFIAGAQDHLTPVAMIRRNARSYRDPVPVETFEGRSHFICNQDGWEEVADRALNWLEQHCRTSG